MSFESPIRSTEAREREKSEQEQKQEIQRQLEFLREKKSLTERREKDKKLAYLKSLIERGLVSLPTAEHIVQGEELETHELQAIFDKIDEIEEVTDIDDILPKILRVTKDEYISAIQDGSVRSDILARLDQSLDYLYNSTHSHASAGVVQFLSSILHSFDVKNHRVNQVQGNIIDIKRDLLASK